MTAMETIYQTYFYPRPPRGGRLDGGDPLIVPMLISIHALREEGDLEQRFDDGCNERFLSTPSARRATYSQLSMDNPSYHFYPRPPRGGRPIHRENHKLCLWENRAVALKR